MAEESLRSTINFYLHYKVERYQINGEKCTIFSSQW